MDLNHILRSRNLTIVVSVVILIAFALLVLAAVLHKNLTTTIDPYIEQSDDLVRQGDQIQVNLLNGCGDQGVARRMMNYLRACGFDVVEIDNYSRFSVQRSFVIDRVGDSVSAMKIARALGIADSLRVLRIDSSLYVRASVVIGKDYRLLRPFQ
ncbi:MAG: LytR C-terminal domain-containing protein [Bacteroidota bacterium]|nr:LytR C-terminal domain-containing protein [Candidatus Kapabacteria bacterium]MDW8221002.1 LytR C-terminal domain-containing protein [Bacteroidota bacterium]